MHMTMLHPLRYCLLAALIGCAAIASAQETETDSAENAAPKPASPILKDLTPIEVRALRANTDAPFAKTEVSGADLQKENLGQDLPILLQYTPSAVTTTDAGAGVGYTGLRIRGTDGTRINVTLNGIPVNDAESQGTYFVDLPDLASSTTSIQIQRGIGSSTNGPGAFGATLSIANLGINDQAGAEGSISYGSFNTQKYTVQAGTGYIRDKVALQVRLSQITSNGFIDRSGSDLKSFQINGAWKISSKTTIQGMVLQGIETTHQAWNGVPEEKLRGNDSALLAHYYSNVGTLYFSPADSANLFSSNPRRYNVFTYDNQIDHYRQNYYQLFADHRFSPSVTAHAGLFLTRGLGYYEEYKSGESYSKYGLQPFTTESGDTIRQTDLTRQLWLDNYIYGAVYSLLWDASKHTRLSFGGAASQYIGNHYGYVLWSQYGGIPEHYRWYKLDAQKNDFNLYGKAEHRIGKTILLYGDLQWRSIGYFMNGFRNNPTLHPAATYNFFNPKAGFTWFLPHTPLMHQKLYASFAAASHEPNRDDFEASPDQLPKPERLYDAEGGYERITDQYSISANAYYMHYTDQLVLTGKVNDVGAYTRTNVPNSYRAGIELQGTVKALDWLSLRANATFSQNRIKDFVEYVDNYDDGTQVAYYHGTTSIGFSPSCIAAGGITLTPFYHTAKGKAFSIDVLEKYVSKQYLDNTSNEARKLNPYGLLDIRLHYNPELAPFRHLGFTLMLNNVLNKEYESNGYTYSYIYGGTSTTQNFYYPQAGFNWLLGVNLKW
jgi:iron complex outermembrane receptor protein